MYKSMKVLNKFNHNLVKVIHISTRGIKNVSGVVVPTDKVKRPYIQLGTIIEGRNIEDIKESVIVWAENRGVNIDLIDKVVF